MKLIFLVTSLEHVKKSSFSIFEYSGKFKNGINSIFSYHVNKMVDRFRIKKEKNQWKSRIIRRDNV